MKIFTKTLSISAFVVILSLFACATVKIPVSLKHEVRQNIREYDIVLSEELINYFSEIAFDPNVISHPRLKTWNKPLRIKIIGGYTPEDSLEVINVIEDLNTILHTTRLSLVNEDYNIIIYFTGREGFKRNAAKHAWEAAGHFYIRWHPKEQYVTAGKILISTLISEKRRKHVIREELTQVLGLMKDSYSYPGSIFYQKYSEVTAYSPIDIGVLKLWDALKPVTGYKKEEVANLLFEILESKP